jgi:predicted transcriptional regulator
MNIFRENYFRAMPVLDKNKKFIGLLTTYDLMIEVFK